MSSDSGAQTVATLGEFALIDRLAGALAEVRAAAAPNLLGIGDDAAIWTPTPNTRAVITTDSLIAGIHFRLDWTTWHDLGHKALAVNLSDIAAMGARPRLATISLGLTGQERVTDLLDLYRGLGTLAAQHNVIIAGGDIVASPERLGLHLTVIGESWPEADGRLLTRDAAHPGDLLATSGHLGLAAAGLKLLLENGRVGQWASGPEDSLHHSTLDTRRSLLAHSPTGPLAHAAHDSRLTTHNYLTAHHRPTPRIAYGRTLIAAGVRVAMDLSDGLFGDLAKICARSNVGARIDEAALPVPANLRAQFPNDWLTLATRGGEDYELLFTAPAAVIDRLRALCAAQNLPAPAIIGAILPPPASAPPITLRRADGNDEAIGDGAFDHFGGR